MLCNSRPKELRALTSLLRESFNAALDLRSDTPAVELRAMTRTASGLIEGTALLFRRRCLAKPSRCAWAFSKSSLHTCSEHTTVLLLPQRKSRSVCRTNLSHRIQSLAFAGYRCSETFEEDSLLHPPTTHAEGIVERA